MSKVYVRTLEDRVARVSPKGPYIPHKEFIGVELTPYINRLANVHKDIELRTTNPAEGKAPKKDAESSK